MYTQTDLKTSQGTSIVGVSVCSEVHASVCIYLPKEMGHDSLRGTRYLSRSPKGGLKELKLLAFEDALRNQGKPIDPSYVTELEVAFREYLGLPIPVEIGIPVEIVQKEPALLEAK